MTEMKSCAETEAEIEEEFSLFDEWMDKYSYIIDLSKGLPPLDEKYRSDEFLIKGCQSQVWLGAEYRDGRVYFQADSDAIITKGLIYLLMRLLSGRTPQEIIEAQLESLKRIGIGDNLSPSRSNGFANMIKQMKMYALAFQTQEG